MIHENSKEAYARLERMKYRQVMFDRAWKVIQKEEGLFNVRSILRKMPYRYTEKTFPQAFTHLKKEGKIFAHPIKQKGEKGKKVTMYSLHPPAPKQEDLFGQETDS